MTHRVAVIGGVLLTSVFVWLLGPAPSDYPFAFFLSIVLVPAGVGMFCAGGLFDGRSAVRAEDRWKLLNVLRLLLAGCGALIVAGIVAVILTPPDPYSMCAALGLLFVVYVAFYFLGFRKGYQQPPREVRISFSRPFQYYLVLLFCIASLPFGPTIWNIPLALLGLVVLFVFRPRANTTQQPEANGDGNPAT